MGGTIQMLGDLIYPFANNFSILINDNSRKRQATYLDIANGQINNAFSTLYEKFFSNTVTHWRPHFLTMVRGLKY